ncbi:hypothetical protein FBY14_105149 [Azospirillum brasilense]|nr:hypothetical protein FBY14_105149 [Azospirillum brasilense]
MDIPDLPTHGALATFPPTASKVKEMAEWLTGLVKITTTLSAILGAPLVWMYMARVGAPFPSVDAALALFLLVFTMMLAALVLMLLLLLMLPITIKLSADTPVRERFPALYKRSGQMTASLRYFLYDYIKLYLPSILFPILVISAYPIGMAIENQSWISAPILLFSSSMIGISYIIVAETRLNIRNGTKWHKNLLSTAYFIVIANFLLLVWLSFVPMFLSKIFDAFSDLSDLVSGTLFLGAFLFVFALHALLTRGEPSLSRIAAAGVAVAVFLVMVCPGGSVLAATALRMLGFGGGMPVTITVKRLDEGKGIAEARKLSGCLILQTGSAVVFKIEAADAKRCRPEMRPLEPFRPASPYEGIIQFQRTDVTEIEAFHGKPPPAPLPPPRSVP